MNIQRMIAQCTAIQYKVYLQNIYFCIKKKNFEIVFHSHKFISLIQACHMELYIYDYLSFIRIWMIYILLKVSLFALYVCCHQIFEWPASHTKQTKSMDDFNKTGSLLIAAQNNGIKTNYMKAKIDNMQQNSKKRKNKQILGPCQRTKRTG